MKIQIPMYISKHNPIKISKFNKNLKIYSTTPPNDEDKTIIQKIVNKFPVLSHFL